MRPDRAKFWKAGVKSTQRSPAARCGPAGQVLDCAPVAAALGRYPCLRRQMAALQRGEEGAAVAGSAPRTNGSRLALLHADCRPLPAWSGQGRTLADLYSTPW